MIFYRIVKGDPPPLADFTSGAALGRPLAIDNPEAARLHTGVSVFATGLQAANTARQWPALGGFIAALFGQEDRRGRTRGIAQGRELVELVLAGEPAGLAQT